MNRTVVLFIRDFCRKYSNKQRREKHPATDERVVQQCVRTLQLVVAVVVTQHKEKLGARLPVANLDFHRVVVAKCDDVTGALGVLERSARDEFTHCYSVTCSFIHNDRIRSQKMSETVSGANR
ncbi:hypothetical protein CBL_10340 [Carabus blaptoides fortunei]